MFSVPPRQNLTTRALHGLPQCTLWEEFLPPSDSLDYRFSGWLAFLADPITLPATGSSDISFAIPFRARVSVSGLLFDSNGGIFTRWEGGGTAHVTFSPTADGRWDNSRGELLRFDFSDAKPAS